MSNIKVAKDAIEAELKHAREGLAFYEERIGTIEAALATLGAVDSPAAETPKRRARAAKASGAEPVVRGRAAKGEKPAKPVKAVRRRSKADTKPEAEGEKLPATGQEFWTGLIGSEPKSASQIYEAAVSALSITPTKDQAKKLGQRMANALSVMSKAGAIKSTGDHGARLYSK